MQMQQQQIQQQQQQTTDNCNSNRRIRQRTENSESMRSIPLTPVKVTYQTRMQTVLAPARLQLMIVLNAENGMVAAAAAAAAAAECVSRMDFAGNGARWI